LMVIKNFIITNRVNLRIIACKKPIFDVLKTQIYFIVRVNFGLAVERAKALIDIPCKIIIVGEDTALTSADR
jgi:hypothetical protein